MNSEQCDAANRFLKAVGVDTTNLPVTGLILDLQVTDVPRLTLTATLFRPEHVKALEELHALRPDITVQFHHPRLPPSASVDVDAPIPYTLPVDHSVSVGATEEPLVPGSVWDEDDGKVIPQEPKDEAGGFTEAVMTYPPLPDMETVMADLKKSIPGCTVETLSDGSYQVTYPKGRR